MIRLMLLLMIVFSATAWADPGECNHLRHILSRVRDNPGSLRGAQLTSEFTRAQVTLPGAYHCLYSEYDSSPIVECIWIAASFQNGQQIFADIRGIIRECPFVAAVRDDTVQAKGNQRIVAELTREIDPGNLLNLSVQHRRTLTFNEAGPREIIVTFSRNNKD